MNEYFNISEEVADALAEGKPVVALESTVIAHGLPYPSNMETALTLEEIIRREGAVPATIAILGGRVCIGLSRDQIEYLSISKGILKLGTRDIASGADGATTVSATSFLANRAGIRVFVTGGIGGVHRGASHTFDISSDLWELANTEIIVVCAGAKAILDLPATLEWLETHQVPVLGYGTDEFPGFYSAHTGLPVEGIDSPEDAARRFYIRQSLRMNGGMLIGVPVPPEYELDLRDCIDQASSEAEQAGVRGKDVTPWILGRLYELTGGRSVATNVELLRNNARIGSYIARAVAEYGPSEKVNET